MATGLRTNEAGQRLRAFEAIDFNTQQGVQIRLWLEAKLQDLREQNDAQNLDAVATAHLRGRIAEIKGLLATAPPVVNIPRFDNVRGAGNGSY